MADVMSHGGDGAGDPPQQPSHRLASTCESAPSLKRRGIFRGINLEMVWQANGKVPLPIVERTMQPFRNNAKYFTRLVGNQVRFTVPPCYPSWTEVPEEQRARTSHQFSGDSQNNDPQFAMYEAQLRQIQREIEILKNRIPVEEENGDENEGLKGP
ncbi:Uncharacterized protein Adt_39476 [Abeliophyllum distichum]|uniref:Uncharacterized protein n=1 Tax=Abeliophyllum distichum TaxID=126358 RepID=A0ABD1Q5E8_9LAMI